MKQNKNKTSTPLKTTVTCAQKRNHFKKVMNHPWNFSGANTVRFRGNFDIDGFDFEHNQPDQFAGAKR